MCVRGFWVVKICAHIVRSVRKVFSKWAHHMGTFFVHPKSAHEPLFPSICMTAQLKRGEGGELKKNEGCAHGFWMNEKCAHMVRSLRENFSKWAHYMRTFLTIDNLRARPSPLLHMVGSGVLARISIPRVPLTHSAILDESNYAN